MKVFVDTENEYYMDGYLKENFDTAKDVIKSDWDMIFVYDGGEGTGKSVKWMQDAYYCDQSFNIDRVAFTPEQFKVAILKADQYQSVGYDEAYGGLSSRASMTRINRTIVKMLTEIRQKNLFVFISLPTFFDLDRYVALWRSRALIHIYSGKGFERGYFAFYNAEKKKVLYMLGKKTYSYSHPSPNFTGRFTNHWVIDRQEYNAKKLKYTSQTEDSNIRIEKMQFAKQLKQSIVTRLKEGVRGLTQKQIADIIGVTTMTIHNYLKQDKETNKIIDEADEMWAKYLI